MPDLPRNLTARFRHWASEHVDYSKLETRVQVDSAAPAGSHTVALRGQRFDGRFVWCARIGWAFFIATLLVKNVGSSLPPVLSGPNLPNWLFLTAALAFAIAEFGKRRTRTFVWIEVKEARHPLGVDVVERTLAAVASARGNPHSSWVPSEVLLVSGEAGFEPDALARASSSGVACYRSAGATFQRVSPRMPAA